MALIIYKSSNLPNLPSLTVSAEGKQNQSTCFKESSLLLQVRVTQGLKQTHAEQMNRLQIKHQAECDLLEDLRWAVKGQVVDKVDIALLHTCNL